MAPMTPIANGIPTLRPTTVPVVKALLPVELLVASVLGLAVSEVMPALVDVLIPDLDVEVFDVDDVTLSEKAADEVEGGR